MLSFVALWPDTQLPSLNLPNSKFLGTLQWPSASLNWSSLLNPSSQASVKMSQTKPIWSSLCLRSGESLSLACLCLSTQAPILNPSDSHFAATLQWPSSSLNWRSLRNPSSHTADNGSQMNPISSSLCLYSGSILSLVLLCLLTQAPILNPSDSHFAATLQWPSSSLNWRSLLNPSSHASFRASQTKPKSSNLCLRSGKMLSFLVRWLDTQGPSLKPSNIKFWLTLQWPLAFRNLASLANPISQLRSKGFRTKPSCKSISCFGLGIAAQLVLWFATHLPRENPSSLCFRLGDACPSRSINFWNFWTPCCHCTSKGSQGKLTSFSCKIWSSESCCLPMRLWRWHQLPKLSPFSTCIRFKFECPFLSKKERRADIETAQSSAKGSQLKLMSSSLCLRSGEILSLACLCLSTQVPRLNPPSLNLWGTLQLPLASLKRSNSPNQNSQDAVLASTNIVLSADENSASTDTGTSKTILSLMFSIAWLEFLAMFVR